MAAMDSFGQHRIRQGAVAFLIDEYDAAEHLSCP
jgi:hypothetical protein